MRPRGARTSACWYTLNRPRVRSTIIIKNLSLNLRPEHPFRFRVFCSHLRLPLLDDQVLVTGAQGIRARTRRLLVAILASLVSQEKGVFACEFVICMPFQVTTALILVSALLICVKRSVHSTSPSVGPYFRIAVYQDLVFDISHQD